MTAFSPGRVPIDGYGNGGFRFAGMSHRGSILIIPAGIYDWRPRAMAGVTADDLALILAERESTDLLILGSGNKLEQPSPVLLKVLKDAHLTYEVMSTGAAVTTYNILFAEARRVSAGLIAVDSPR